MTVIILLWYSLLAFFLAIKPAIAPYMLREFHRSVVIHFMYGASSGKSLWLPLFFAVGCLIANFGIKAVPRSVRPRFERPKIAPAILIGLISVLLWYFGFRQVDEAAKAFQMNPYTDGQLVSFCDEGSFFHEFISYEHPHSLKEIVSRLFTPVTDLISGDSFTRMHKFDLLYPTSLLAAALVLFLTSLAAFRSATFIETVSYITGFFILFFSYFDGGILSGGQGLVFLFYPFIPRHASILRSRELTSIVAFGAAVAFQIAGQRAFHLISEIPFDDTLATYRIAFYTERITLSRLMILCVFNAFAAFSFRKSISAGSAIAALGFFVYGGSQWVYLDSYLRTIQPGQRVLVRMFTGNSPKVGETLVRGKNLHLILYTGKFKIKAWDLCVDLLRRADGLSYRSLIVTTYCSVNEITPLDFEKAYRYTALNKGSCGFECSPKLKELYRLEAEPSGKRILHGYVDIRDKGLALCIDQTTRVASDPETQRVGSDTH